MKEIDMWRAVKVGSTALFTWGAVYTSSVYQSAYADEQQINQEIERHVQALKSAYKDQLLNIALADQNPPQRIAVAEELLRRQQAEQTIRNEWKEVYRPNLLKHKSDQFFYWWGSLGSGFIAVISGISVIRHGRSKQNSEQLFPSEDKAQSVCIRKLEQLPNPTSLVPLAIDSSTETTNQPAELIEHQANPTDPFLAVIKDLDAQGKWLHD